MNQQVKLAARTYGVQGGLEILAYDGFTRAVLKRQNQTTDHRQAAVLLGHELTLGHFRFGQQLGIYAGRTPPSPTLFTTATVCFIGAVGVGCWGFRSKRTAK